MPETPILEMPAGRELDALVAEKVMGWSAKGPYLVPPELADKLLDHHQVPDLPAFSTNIAAAWQVVEKLRADDRSLQVEVSALTSKRREPLLRYDEEDETKATAYADTASLAICRAALLLVEAKRA